MTCMNDAKEYQDVLKTVALSFLERHQCEHLGDDQQLFSRTVQHLVATYDVQLQNAERIVHLAGSEMIAVRDRQRLDVATSTSTYSVIVDPLTGAAWVVPVSLIVERILNGPDVDRYRLANS